MKKITLGLIGVILVNGFCFSQSKISGSVVDAETKQGLPFAFVNIKDKTIGTITNDDGEFDLYVGKENSNDSLIVSFMGYRSYTQSIQVIGDKADLKIYLQQQPIMLQQITISAKELDPRAILIKSFENIKKNYPLDPYIYKGFLRQVGSQNGKAVSLVESAFDIHDDGYKPNRKNTVRVREIVNLKNVRASKNYMNDAFKVIGERNNTLTSALRWNQVKYPNQIIKNLKGKECTLERVIYQNGDSLCVISFITHSATNESFERKDTFYINARTFAIHKMEWKEYAIKGEYRNKPWLLPDSIHRYAAKDVSTVYDFEEYQGKMYLKYFHERGSADIYNTKTNRVDFKNESDVIMVVTEIESVKATGTQINTMDNGKSLRLQATAYDPAFWNDNKELTIVPLTPKLIRDLQWEMPLEEQFKKQGSK